MKYGLSESEIQQIKDVFEKYSDVRTVYIYGSRAKNTFTAKSDIDLAVEFKPNATTNIGTIKSDLEDLPIIFEFDLTDQADITPGKFQDAYNLTKQVFHKVGWTETTLGEVTSIIGDGLHGTPTYSNDGEYYFINGNNLDSGKIIIKNDTKRVDSSQFNKYKKDLNERTILLSINGTIGNLAKYNNEKCILGKSAAYLNIKEDINKDYIFYLMTSEKFQYNITKNATGSTIKNVGLNQLRNIQINLPPLDEQKSIAEILSAFDDKIELLRDQNKTLESLGQTIFKEWFGKYSPDRPEELPEGWRVGKLGDVGSIICGKTPSKDNPNYFGGKIPFIKIPDMHGQTFIIDTEDSLTELGANSQKNKYIPTKSICVSCIATVGLVSITTTNSQTNQQINSIVPEKENLLEYTYYLLTSMKNDLLAIGSGGSTTLNINTSTFSNIKIVIPTELELSNFNKTVRDIFSKQLENLKQINSLSENKKLLLYKLIN